MKDILLLTSSQEKGHSMPHRIRWRITRFGQEAEAGVREKHRPQNLLGFLQEKHGRTG